MKPRKTLRFDSCYMYLWIPICLKHNLKKRLLSAPPPSACLKTRFLWVLGKFSVVLCRRALAESLRYAVRSPSRTTKNFRENPPKVGFQTRPREFEFKSAMVVYLTKK